MSKPTNLDELNTMVTVKIIKDGNGIASLSANIDPQQLSSEKVGVMSKVIGNKYDEVIDESNGNLKGPAIAGGSSSHSSRGGKSRKGRKSKKGGKSRKGRKSLRRK